MNRFFLHRQRHHGTVTNDPAVINNLSAASAYREVSAEEYQAQTTAQAAGYITIPFERYAALTRKEQ